MTTSRLHWLRPRPLGFHVLKVCAHSPVLWEARKGGPADGDLHVWQGGVSSNPSLWSPSTSPSRCRGPEMGWSKPHFADLGGAPPAGWSTLPIRKGCNSGAFWGGKGDDSGGWGHCCGLRNTGLGEKSSSPFLPTSERLTGEQVGQKKALHTGRAESVELTATRCGESFEVGLDKVMGHAVFTVASARAAMM